MVGVVWWCVLGDPGLMNDLNLDSGAMLRHHITHAKYSVKNYG